jgi:hypothetical protein
MSSIVLCVLNVCKPQEYPGLLRSYINRKIDLIKKNNKKIYLIVTHKVKKNVFLLFLKPGRVGGFEIHRNIECQNIGIHKMIYLKQMYHCESS